MAVGMIRAIKINGRAWRFAEDVEANFWAGGIHNAEYLNDNVGGTAKIKNTVGFFKGITLRAGDTDDLEDLIDMVKSGVRSNLDALFELASGEKWSAPVKPIISDDGPFTSAEGKFAVDFYAANGTGEFVKL
jgi:hypothetical protein